MDSSIDIKKILAAHKEWLKNGGDSRDDLSRADLSEANLDFASWPLWCGSMNVKVDINLVRQLLAHVCAVDCADEEFAEIRKTIMPFAVKSHRAEDLGLLNDGEESDA